MRTIGIWCEHNFQLYSALPVIEKYLANNNVIIFTKKENTKVINELIIHRNFKTENINNYLYKPAGLFKQLFEILFISENFSYVYKNEFVKKESFKKRVLRKIFFLKIPPRKINRAYSSLSRLFFKKKSIDNFFRLDLMITFTKVYYSYLIPPKEIVPHINIMESWDHPMKFPYYISPNYCLTWNSDLAGDTRQIQSLMKVKQIKPLKLRYIDDYQNINDHTLLKSLEGTNYYNELMVLKDKKIVLYPTTTSSSGLMHDGEMKLIDELCSTFEKSEYLLYIKPKPNAPKGDYETFEKYSNVIVGIYSSNKMGSDMLDEKYHIFRYLLLNESKVVINAGTTFVLEAALMNKFIIQLDLKANDYLGFAKFCKTYHLSKYVLSLFGVIKFDGTSNSKNRLLEEVQKDKNLFSIELKKWITNW